MWWTNFFEKLRKNSAKKRIQRQFLLILVVFALGYLGYGYWKHFFSIQQALLGLGVTFLFGLVLYILPRLLKPLLYLWLLLGMLLGEITSFILLGIIYYLLFFPITFILRVTRKNTLGTPKWHTRLEDVIDYRKLS